MGGQAAGELGRVGLGPIETDGEGPHPAQGQEGLQRPGDGAVQAAVLAERLPSVRVGGDGRSHHQVRVTGEELGHAVDHDVGAQLEGPLEQRRGERVVDHHGDAQRPGSPAQGAQVGDRHHGIGRGLAPQQVGTIAGGQRGRRVGDVDEPDAEPPGRRAAPGCRGRRPRVPRPPPRRAGSRGRRRWPPGPMRTRGPGRPRGRPTPLRGHPRRRCPPCRRSGHRQRGRSTPGARRR